MPQQHVIEFQGNGPATEYNFSVSGLCVPEADLYEADNDQFRVDGASGWVTRPENIDRYHFTGEITSFDFPVGECIIRVNGSQVSSNAVVGMGGYANGNGDSNGNGSGDGNGGQPGYCDPGDCPTGFVCQGGLCVEESTNGNGNGDGTNGNGDGQNGGQNGQNGNGNGGDPTNGNGGQNGGQDDGGVFGDGTVRLIAGAAVLRALLN